MRPHADGCRRLSILIGGELTEGGATRTELARVGSVALKAPDFVHHDRFGRDGTTILSVVLSDRVVERLGYDVRDLRPWHWHHGGAPSLTALRLAIALVREDGTGALSCLESLLGSFSREMALKAPPAPRHLARLAVALREAPGSPPRVADRAAEGGVHPVALGRAFRRHFGCSISHFRQRCRVTSVAHALIGGRAPLVAIALDHGFSDLSHMSRIFRREIGIPPGLFRSTLGAVLDAGAPPRAEWRLGG
jgi:AraC-like DNA-binding protein